MKKNKEIATDKIVVKITDAISTVTALKIVVLIIVLWLIVGSITKVDPFPYLFSSTITNFSGFILTIAILISTKSLEKLQKESEKRDEEHQEQHYKMQGIEERLVNHINESQEKQNEVINEIAKKLGVDV